MLVLLKANQNVTVDDLLVAPFWWRSPEEKEKIVKQGRPSPPLIRTSEAAYADLPWLTASATTRRYYCWPCLLFEDNNPGGEWNEAGIPGIEQVRRDAEEHRTTPAHLQAAFRLQHFDQLDARRTEPPVEDAAIVDKGRHQYHPEAARRLADAACSMASLQRPVPEYLKTLALLRKYDAGPKNHSDQAIRWLQASPEIHGRVVAAVAKLVRKKVAEAARGSRYVTLVLARHSKDNVSSVLRYVRQGKVEERFLGFASVPESGGAPAVYQHVRTLLQELDAGPRLVALSTDAGVVDTGDRDALLVRLRREDAPLCRLAPWHSHSPDRILRQCLQRGRPVIRKFFACLRALECAFRDSSELCSAAPEAQALCDALSGGGFLRYVQRHGPLLAQLLDSNKGATRFLGAWLRDATTAFLIDALARLSGPTAALGTALRGYVPERHFGAGGSVTSAASDLLWELRNLTLRGGSAPGDWWAEALDCAAAEVRARYCDLNRFRFCCLFDFLEEGWFRQSSAYLRDLLGCYGLGATMNVPRTRAELDLLWAHMSFSKRSAYDFHQHLHDSHLSHSFRSLFDLSELVLAMPFKHASLDRDTSLWERINAAAELLPDDACLLAVESDYLQELRQQPEFSDEVLAILSDCLAD